jgi:hypothetical protein
VLSDERAGGGRLTQFIRLLAYSAFRRPSVRVLRGRATKATVWGNRSTAFWLAPEGAQQGDYHERTNQIGTHFSPKIIFACGNRRSPGRAGNHAVYVIRSRSTKRSSACRPTGCSKEWREEENEKEKGYAGYDRSGEQPARSTETAVARRNEMPQPTGRCGWGKSWDQVASVGSWSSHRSRPYLSFAWRVTAVMSVTLFERNGYPISST